MQLLNDLPARRPELDGLGGQDPRRPDVLDQEAPEGPDPRGMLCGAVFWACIASRRALHAFCPPQIRKNPVKMAELRKMLEKDKKKDKKAKKDKKKKKHKKKDGGDQSSDSEGEKPPAPAPAPALAPAQSIGIGTVHPSRLAAINGHVAPVTRAPRYVFGTNRGRTVVVCLTR
jgi:hypothetical protein